MSIVRHASAAGSGPLKEGRDAISAESGALEAKPYGYRSRLEGERGTNPEELLGARTSGPRAGFGDPIPSSAHTASAAAG